MHNLHPVAKLMLMLPPTVAISFYMDPFLLIIITLVVVYLGHLSGVPLSWYGFLLFAILVSLPQQMLGGGVIFLYDPKWYIVYKEFLGFDIGHVIINITPKGFPVIGQSALTIGGLLYQTQIFVKRILAFAVVYLVMYTTSPSEVISVLAAAGVPSPIMFIMMAFFRFCILIQRKTLQIVSSE